MAPAVEWRYDATTQPWLRALLLVGAGALYGAAVLLYAGIAVLLGVVLWSGDTGTRLFVLLLVLVGGPFSLIYLWPMLGDPDQRPRFYPRSVERVLSTRQKLAVGTVGAAVLAVTGWVSPSLATGLVALGLVAGLAYLFVRTRGTIDSERAAATSGPREWDLSRVTGYRTRRFGPLVLVTLESGQGPGRWFGSRPSRVSVPTRDAPAVTDALDAIVADNADREDDARDPNPHVRWVAGGFAVLFVGIGVGALVLVNIPFGWYVAAICWLFAAIFAVVAREG